MKPFKWSILVLVAVALGLGVFHSRSNGAHWVSEDAGVSFELPKDQSWQITKSTRPEAKLALQRTDGTSAVFFVAFEKKHDHKEVNEEVVQGWERGYYRKSSAIKISGEFFSFKGKHAYKAADEEVKDGITVRGAVILWLEDGRLFDIVAWKNDADPLKDEAIKAFVDSIKFLPKATK